MNLKKLTFQGNQIKLPNVEKKPLDIHALHKVFILFSFMRT